jgi:hypothetical protein
MPKSTDKSFPRRTFIRGAAGLLGASALGVPTAALAAPLAAMPVLSTALSVMFWDGKSFFSADSLVSGDQTLASVQITLKGSGPTAEIRAINLIPLVRTADGPREAPFYAWTAPPAGLPTTRCVMPVDLKSGLSLSARVLIGKEAQDCVVPFSVTKDLGPKLCEGRYVLCAASVSWSDWELLPNGQLARRSDGAPADFQYVVLTVARA